MILDERTSTKIRTISMVAMLAVVAWHSECGASVEKWVIPWFTTWSVPWFFLVSGFFFVKTADKMGRESFLRKKFKSLLIPYTFWCVVGWCLWQPSLSGCGGELLGLSSAIFPRGNWPLWYVRALIIFMLISILIYPLCMRLRRGFLSYGLFSVLVLMVYLLLIRIGVGVSPGSSVVFFLLGCGLAVSNLDLNGGRMRNGLCLLLCVASFVLMILLRLSFDSHVTNNLAIAASIFGIWLLVDLGMSFHQANWILYLTPGIYFMHGPLIKTFDKYLEEGIVSGMNAWQMNVYYFARTIGFFVLVGLLCHAIKRFFPRFAAIVFGGR